MSYGGNAHQRQAAAQADETLKIAQYRRKNSGLRRTIRTVDSHTEGNPTRVIMEGVPVPPGGTLLEKQQWLAEHDDALRKILCFEPRGGGLMCSVLLMPPLNADSDFSVIIMEQDAYVPMSGHCIIGAATTVVETGLVPATSPVTVVRFDALAGRVTCYVKWDGNSAQSVTFDNVDSFLHQSGASIEVEGFGRLEVDIAYGGEYYAIVDADRLNLELRPDRDAELIAASVAIREAVADQLDVVHPGGTPHPPVLPGSIHFQGDPHRRLQADDSGAPRARSIARPAARGPARGSPASTAGAKSASTSRSDSKGCWVPASPDR